jgi:hypothetical protein
MKGTGVKTIEMEDVQHEFSALCQEVASTGQAVAVTHGQIVATLNVRHFSLIPNLPVEDWPVALP